MKNRIEVCEIWFCWLVSMSVYVKLMFKYVFCSKIMKFMLVDVWVWLFVVINVFLNLFCRWIVNSKLLVVIVLRR